MPTNSPGVQNTLSSTLQHPLPNRPLNLGVSRLQREKIQANSWYLKAYFVLFFIFYCLRLSEVYEVCWENLGTADAPCVCRDARCGVRFNKCFSFEDAWPKQWKLRDLHRASIDPYTSRSTQSQALLLSTAQVWPYLGLKMNEQISPWEIWHTEVTLYFFTELSLQQLELTRRASLK